MGGYEGPRAGALCACTAPVAVQVSGTSAVHSPYLCRLCGHIIVLPVHGKHIDMRPRPQETKAL